MRSFQTWWAARVVLLAVASASLACTNSFAKDDSPVRTAASLLPKSIVAYAEVASAPDLIRTVLSHPLRNRIESLPQYIAFTKNDQYHQFEQVLHVIEMQLGKKWRPAVESLSAHGVFVAFDAASEGGVLLAHADDATFLVRARELLIRLARADAEDHGRPDPVRSVRYRGISAHRIGELRMAVAGSWLVVTNKDDLGKAILDNYLEETNGTAANNPRLQQAMTDRNDSASVWAWVDLTALRSAGVADDIFTGRAPDPAAELLAGGILGTLSKSPFATAALRIGKEHASLTLSAPAESDAIPKTRAYYFGPANRGAIPRPIELPDTILSIRTYRDIGQMWLNGPDLFDENVNADLAKTNSEFSTLFGGREFASEILGALDGGLQFVATKQDFENGDRPNPSIKLPSFAAIGRLKDAKASQRTLRIAFQTAVGFANLTGAENGLPPLEMETDRQEGVLVLSANYAAEDWDKNERGSDDANRAAAPMRFNFSPSIAFVNDRLVLASTRSIATSVAKQLTRMPSERPQPATVAAGAVINTAVRLDVPVLRRVLVENRGHLVAQNMLEEGHDRAHAEKEIDAILGVAKWFQSADAKLLIGDDRLQLVLNVAFADN